LFEFPQIKSFIGNGVPVLIQRVMAARDLDSADQTALISSFLDYYEADATTLTRPYPKAIETLQWLQAQGHRLGICTNKPEGPTRSILAEFALSDLFETVIGGDTLAQKKPDPAPLVRAMAELGDGPAIFVGDSEVDAETAKRAGVPFALFTEGYRKSSLQDMPHGASFSDFSRLPEALSALMPAR
jgi:phosphoglycolate phosphatase